MLGIVNSEIVKVTDENVQKEINIIKVTDENVQKEIDINTEVFG